MHDCLFDMMKLVLIEPLSGVYEMPNPPTLHNHDHRYECIYIVFPPLNLSSQQQRTFYDWHRMDHFVLYLICAFETTGPHPLRFQVSSGGGDNDWASHTSYMIIMTIHLGLIHLVHGPSNMNTYYPLMYYNLVSGKLCHTITNTSHVTIMA